MTGHDHGQRVASHCLADRLRQGLVTELLCQRAVGHRLAAGDVPQEPPHPLLERITVRSGRQVEGRALRGQVLVELAGGQAEQSVVGLRNLGSERVLSGHVPVVRKMPAVPDPLRHASLLR